MRRLSLVEIITVSCCFGQAASSRFPSGMARNRLPPRQSIACKRPSTKASRGIDDVHSVLLRRLEAEKLHELGDRDERHLFGDADRALALDVGVAAHRAAASARATDITAKQQQIDQHPDVGRAVSLLGQPHAIDADHLLSLNIDLGGLVQIFPRRGRIRRSIASQGVARAKAANAS